jgi:hypothetical protein
MTTDVARDASARTRRRRALATLAAAGLAAVLAAGLFLGNGDDQPAPAAPGSTESTPPASAPVTSTPAPSPAPTPTPTGPTSDVDELPPSLPAVALDEEADVGNGISAAIVSVEAIDGTATGPGNVAGPAVRVTVRLANGTAAPLSLDGVAVDLAHGSDLTPASPLDDPSARPFTGTVAAGDSADGVYVFSVDEQSRESVTVSVGYQAGAPFMVFTGPVR